MGFGCNAAGVVGARIIDSPRERLIAILTNNFVPCNGRFPFLITIAGISILNHIANFLNPFANLMGLDGYILTAFILALPANEIVLPIILMSYMAGGNLVQIEDLTSISNILISNGWTILTAINVMLFSLMHFP